MRSASGLPPHGYVPAPASEIEEVDLAYARAGERELVIRLTRPRRFDAPLPVLLDFHGGAWTHFDHRVDLAWCRALARAGVACASVEFRQAPRHPWPTFLADARAALRWLTAHGAALGLDVLRLGTIGGSTGGYLSVLLALCPDSDGEVPTQALDTPPDLQAARPRVGIGFYPILDVVGRYRMVRGAEFSPATRWLRERFGPPLRRPGDPLRSPVERLDALERAKQRNPWLGSLVGAIVNRGVDLAGRVPFLTMAVYEELALAHEGAFRDEAEMHLASPLARVIEGRVGQTPPLLIIQGRDDVNVTPEMAEAFAVAYRARGGIVDLDLRTGFPHAFASVPSPQSDYAISRVLRFLAAHALLTPRRTPDADVNGHAAEHADLAHA